MDLKLYWIYQLHAQPPEVEASQLWWLHLFWRFYLLLQMFNSKVKFWFFTLFFSAKAFRWKLLFGTSKTFPKKICSLYVSFQLIYGTFWCLFTDLTLFILFWISQWAEFPWHSSGRPAGLPTFCRWTNWETKHLKWRNPDLSCMLFAFDLWFSANYSQQTNEDRHLHTSSCRSVPRYHQTVCVVCCFPLPWLIFCPFFLVLDPSLPFSGHISWSFFAFLPSMLCIISLHLL